MAAEDRSEAALIARLMRRPGYEMDEGLPRWARRTHPMVRRQLGPFWKLMPINVRQIARIIAMQWALLAAALALPGLIGLVMPVSIVSLVILPAALALHVRTLGRIAIRAASSMVIEREDDALELLRVTPLPLQEIIDSKAAAAVWREVEDVALVLIGLATSALPLALVLWDSWLGLDVQPLAAVLAAGTMLLVGVLRVPLEALAAAGLGLAVGASARSRTAGRLLAVIGLGVFLAAVNLPRLLPWPPLPRVLVELALPLAAPALLALVCLRVVRWQIERDR
jgi:hypothetical protein